MPVKYIDSIDDGSVFGMADSFGGGQDGFTPAATLAPDQYQYGSNIFIPDNLYARTRPGADRVATNLTNKIQGLSYFDTPTIEQLITASNGVLYYTNSALAAWTQMNGWTLADGAVALSAAQGIDKLLITDGSTTATWDGTNLTPNGVGVTDPPTGCTILLWHAGRMWAAGFPGGTAGKETDAICCSALLTFATVGDWNLTDRSFRVGMGDGDPIMGLVSIPASVPEQAVLGVLKQNSIHIIRTDPTDTTNILTQSKVAPETVANGIGVVGKRAFCVVDNDLLFISTDKSFRSLARMEAAAAQYAVGPALSTPLQPYIDRINWTYQSLFAVTRYKQIVLFSVALDNATSPNTVFAWNGRLQRWMGVWTGWTPNSWEVTRFSGVQRLMHGDNAGNVRQWKDYSDATDDATYLDDGVDIATGLWTRAFNFTEPWNNKDLQNFEARFATANSLITFTLMGDNVQLKQWTADLRATGPNLEQDLEFDLENAVDVATRRGLRGLTPCNEFYLKIESASGWWSLRSVALEAMVNTLRT